MLASLGCGRVAWLDTATGKDAWYHSTTSAVEGTPARYVTATRCLQGPCVLVPSTDDVLLLAMKALLSTHAMSSCAGGYIRRDKLEEGNLSPHHRSDPQQSHELGAPIHP